MRLRTSPGMARPLRLLAFVMALSAFEACAARGGGTTDAARIRDARSVVDRFRDGMASGDPERNLALYRDDVVMYRSDGRPPVGGREAMRPIEEFHAVVRPQVTYHGHEFALRGERVVVSIGGATEQAPLFAAMGLPRVTMRALQGAMEIEDGRIVVMREAGFKPSCERVIPEAIRLTRAWLLERGDPRLEVVAPGGRPRVDGVSAAPWIAAIGDWRRASGWAPPASDVEDCGRYGS